MTETASPPSNTAVRMRALRRRRRQGEQCVTVQMGPEDIDRLITTGYLGPKERDDNEAIEAASSMFLHDALADQVWAQ